MFDTHLLHRPKRTASDEQLGAKAERLVDDLNGQHTPVETIKVLKDALAIAGGELKDMTGISCNPVDTDSEPYIPAPWKHEAVG